MRSSRPAQCHLEEYESLRSCPGRLKEQPIGVDKVVMVDISKVRGRQEVTKKLASEFVYFNGQQISSKIASAFGRVLGSRQMPNKGRLIVPQNANLKQLHESCRRNQDKGHDCSGVQALVKGRLTDEQLADNAKMFYKL
jgi:hypothetical protein